MESTWKLVNVCPVLVCNDVQRTTDFYVQTLGFNYAKHFDKAQQFSAIYKDQIELILVRRKKGIFESNQKRYGSGEDIYINPNSLDGVRALHVELKSKNLSRLSDLYMTDYGSLEFTFEDIDGRTIAVGLIADRKVFFGDSDRR